MNIDYKNLPFLKDIEDGTLDHFKLCDYSDTTGHNLCLDLISKVWADIAPRIRANVCYPCKTYIEAVSKSASCFDKLIQDAMGDYEKKEWVDTMTPDPLTEDEIAREERIYAIVGNSYGCYILSLEGEMIVYAFGKDPIRHMIAFEVIHDKVIRCFAQVGEDYAYFVTNNPGIASIFIEISDEPIAICAQLQHEAQMLVMFERYAKIETRYLNPKTRARLDFKKLDTTANETRLKVNIRDSKYFTEVFRNESFGVRGHLRLQPVKVNGEWTRKLIYIDSFIKHGYHRRAQIDKS